MLPASRPDSVNPVHGCPSFPSLEDTRALRDAMLVSESRRSPGRPVPGGSRSRSMLKVWLVDTVQLRSDLHDIRNALTAVRLDRRLPRQLELTRLASPSCSGPELGQAVLNNNRLLVDLESSFLRKQERRRIRLECTQELLTPQILLHQARGEWCALQDQLAGRLPDYGMHRQQEKVVGYLVDLMEALHPGAPLPDAQRWVAARVEDLELNRDRLIAEMDGDDALV